MLEACKKQYQKFYLEKESLKKKYKEEQVKSLKYGNHYRCVWTPNKTLQDRKFKLSDIMFDEEKLRNLLSIMQNRKPKIRPYYNDVYSDDGI